METQYNSVHCVSAVWCTGRT